MVNMFIASKYDAENSDDRKTAGPGYVALYIRKVNDKRLFQPILWPLEFPFLLVLHFSLSLSRRIQTSTGSSVKTHELSINFNNYLWLLFKIFIYNWVLENFKSPLILPAYWRREIQVTEDKGQSQGFGSREREIVCDQGLSHLRWLWMTVCSCFKDLNWLIEWLPWPRVQLIPNIWGLVFQSQLDEFLGKKG